jgi:hypothetical protein
VSTAQASTPKQRIAAAIVGATHDEAWRVREMAAKVIARHRVGDARVSAP